MLDVVVLDDHRMVAQAIAGVLSEVVGLHVRAVCSSVQEACAEIRRSSPRLLVLDVDLAGEDFRQAAACQHACNPQGELLFITGQAQGFSPPSDLAAITIGVLDKAKGWDELVELLLPWRDSQVGASAAFGCEQQLDAIVQLSPREKRVLLELGSGLLNKEIAVKLGLSVSTVETYRKGIAAKLAISGAELVRLASLYRSTAWDLGVPPEG